MREEAVIREEVVIRSAQRQDAHQIERLVAQSGILDRNSCYAYLLLCTHFADTCAVALEKQTLVGFVTAYFPPRQPNTLFVWQVGVAPSAQGKGIGKRLLQFLLDSIDQKRIDEIRATVSPSNQASRRLFQSLARNLDWSLVEQPGFVTADFGDHTRDNAHEDEPQLVLKPKFPSPSKV